MSIAVAQVLLANISDWCTNETIGVSDPKETHKVCAKPNETGEGGNVRAL